MESGHSVDDQAIDLTKVDYDPAKGSDHFPKLPILPEQKEYLFREYEGIRSEVIQHLDEVRKLDRFAVVTIGAAVAWILQYPAESAGSVKGFVPAILAFGFGFKRYLTDLVFDSFNSHLLKIERLFNLKSWEHHVNAQP